MNSFGTLFYALTVIFGLMSFIIIVSVKDFVKSEILFFGITLTMILLSLISCLVLNTQPVQMQLVSKENLISFENNFTNTKKYLKHENNTYTYFIDDNGFPKEQIIFTNYTKLHISYDGDYMIETWKSSRRWAWFERYDHEYRIYIPEDGILEDWQVEDNEE